MKLLQQILINNDCYKSNKTITPIGIMWHSTGVNNPNLSRYVQPDDGTLGKNKYNNHWNRPNVKKCTHAFIGKDKNGRVVTYQTLPWNMRGWHCGSGKNGSGNDMYIGFEICEDNLKDVDYFNYVYQEACELTAYLCKEFKLDPLADGVIICHAEGYTRGIASNHGDVLHWFKKYGKTMDDVRKDVKTLLTPKAPVPKYYPKYTGKNCHLDTMLKVIGVPVKYRAGWKSRIPLAEVNGIKGYVGSASQNSKLKGLAKTGKLIKV